MGGAHSKTAGKAISFLLLAGSILVLTATGRLVHEGNDHFNEALRLRSSNDEKAAIARFEDAAKAYVPGSPYPGRALRELQILAKSVEMRGDPSRAAAIWDVVRRSVLASRHFFQPNTELLKNAEREIARLRANKGADKPGADPVSRPRDPNPFASLLLFFGMVGWIGGAVALCLIAPKADSEKRRARGYAWIVCIGGLALWIVMAWMAG